MHGQTARAFELFPQIAATLQFKVVKAGMVGQLPWGNRQRHQRNTRQLQVNQIADAFGRPYFYLRRKA